MKARAMLLSSVAANFNRDKKVITDRARIGSSKSKIRKHSEHTEFSSPGPMMLHCLEPEWLGR